MAQYGVRAITFPRMVHPVVRGRSTLRVSTRALPILEAMAEAGQTLPDSPEKIAGLERSIETFRKSAGRMIGDAIKSEAIRYKTGFYRNHDPDAIEKRRMIGLLTVSMHLVRAMERSYERTRELGDAGTSSLFEVALGSVSSLLNDGFFDLKDREFLAGYAKADLAVQACLNRCGLADLAMPLDSIVRSYANELQERVLADFRALH